MALPPIMSLEEVDAETLKEICKISHLSPEQIEDIYACTPLQSAAVAESAIHAGTSLFQFVFYLGATIQPDRFCQALQHVVSLNPILRTRFVDCRHGLVQVVTNDIHVTHQPSGSLEEYMQADKAQPWILGEPFFRSALIERRLILTMHHGIADHASLTPLFDDVISIYHGHEPRKHAPFKDFVVQCLEIEESNAKPFWDVRFKGVPAVFPKVKTGYVPLTSRSTIRKIELRNAYQETSRAHIPSILEVAWAMTAANYTDNESNAFGLVISGRTSAIAAAETTLGPTIAVVPVQVTIKTETTVESILKERSAARRELQANAALQYGLTRIRAVSDAARSAAGFQTLLNIRPRWFDSQDSAEVTYEDMDEPHGAFALSLSCDLEDAAVSIQAACDPAVLDDTEMNHVMNQFEHFAKSLLTAPRSTKLGRIPRLNSNDLAEIMRRNRAEPKPVMVDKTIHELFRICAQERLEVTAIVAHDGSLTYGELDQLSDRLSNELQRKGIMTEIPVAFLFEKSLWTVVAVLGILKAGGTCVPISTADPPERQRTLISKAEAKLLLTSSAQFAAAAELGVSLLEVSAETLAELSSANVSVDDNTTSGAHLAFIIFTSGSTGLPKGVMLEHRNIASTLQAFITKVGLIPNTRMLQFAAHVWDASLAEIFGALLSGSCLCIPSDEDRESNLAGFIGSCNVNTACLTPTVLRTITPLGVPSLKLLVSIGEAISADMSASWSSGLSLWNGWGPCEAAILSAMARLTPDMAFPESIGTALNCTLWIVNPKDVNELVPVGAVGEVLIQGPGVSRGYLKDEAKSRASFIKTPRFAEEVGDTSRFYRTGDLAKYNNDGSICFIGRQDTQVKLRGQRLELGEVEGIIASHDSVRDVFTATRITKGRTELVAVICLTDLASKNDTAMYQVTGRQAAQSLRQVRDHTRAKLPAYMVPSVWLAVNKMPRTTSAKLDRVALGQWLKTQDLATARAALEGEETIELTPPCTKDESLLQQIWASLLAVPLEKIGRETFFGQLGGDSILGIHVAGQCLRRGLKVGVASLLSRMSLAEIAEASRPSHSQNANLLSTIDLLSLQRQVADQTAAHLAEMATTLSRLEESNLNLAAASIEAVVPATHSQTVMLAVGETDDRGYYIRFDLDFRPSLEPKRLLRACEQVVQHHAVLRTVFISQASQIYQVVLKKMPSTALMLEKIDGSIPTLTFREGHPLVFFGLLPSSNHTCQRLYLEIHHALYDAISLSLILADLVATYEGELLSDGLDYYLWSTYLESQKDPTPHKFWKERLQGACMLALLPSVPGGIRGSALVDQVSFRVPFDELKTLGTVPSVVNAAWALLLSTAMQADDVIFGEVSANRFLPLPGIDKVRGPCVNLVPVRARIDPSMTIETLIAQIHDWSMTGIPYHHLDTGTIIRECTSWPAWGRFSTAVVFQSHDVLRQSFKMGDAEVTISDHGKLGDSVDLHVIVTPMGEELHMELRYSSQSFPDERIGWITKTFEIILTTFASGLRKTSAEVGAAINEAVGSYKVPPQIAVPTSSLYGDITPSPASTALVSQVWQEIGLVPQPERASMWDCGATVSSPLLLSIRYRELGYDISTTAIIQGPVNWEQAILLDLVTRAKQTGERPLPNTASESKLAKMVNGGT